MDLSELNIPGAIPDAANQSVGAGDFARAAGTGAADMASNLAALSRYYFEAGQNPHASDISRGIQELMQVGSEAAQSGMSDKAKMLMSSTLTSQEFWDHPVLASALKTTGMSPSLVALALPGGVFADTVAATMATAAAGGALNAGTGLDEFYRKLDETSDEDLQKQSPKYQALREVLDEKSARNRFMREAQGWAPAINAVIGAGAAAVGPAGTLARGAVAAPAAGRVASAGVGALEGAVGNAVQGGASDVLNQQTLVDANFQKDLDYARSVNAAVEGGALGGALGGLAGAVLGGGRHGPEAPAATPARARNADDVRAGDERLQAVAPQPNTGYTTGTPARPVVDPTIGNPKSAPTRSSRDGAKSPAVAKGKGGSKVDPAPVVAPDIAQATAMASQEPKSQAPNVNEVLERLQAAQQPPAPAPAPPAPGTPPAPVQEATQRVAAAPQLDTGQNTPEKPAAVAAQQAQVGQGDRLAVMYPHGSPVPPTPPPGLARVSAERGVFDYDPKRISAEKIQQLSALGRENEILGLGPVSKPEAVARAAGGEKPVAVTERTPAGDEVKAALGTDQTAPQQVASLEANKTPGNAVRVENPADVVAARAAMGVDPMTQRTGRILRDLRSPDETAPLDNATVRKNLGPELDEEGNEKRVGKNYTAKEKAAKEEQVTKAKDIVEAHAPGDDEGDYLRNPEHRDRAIARARAMVEQAAKDGVSIRKRLKTSVNKDSAADSPAMQVLTAASDLLKVANKRKAGKELTDATARFKEDEALIRGGYSEEVLARRRAEGDQAMRRGEVRSDASGEETATSGAVRGLDDGTETTAKGEVRAKAASPGRTLSAEEKAAIAAKLGLTVADKTTKGAPERAPTKKTVQQEALRVNTNPTEAQKRAGNYKKGHRRVEGLDYTIENPRGSVRRGTDGQNEWSVRMPADYGYLRRTRGADGDHIDAYDLKTGDRNFIIDQLDHRTGEFDEHKVVLRAKDEEHALDAYRNAFSDGRADDRLGHVHEVTKEELHDWLAQGNHQEPHIVHVARDLNSSIGDIAAGEHVVQVLGGDEVRVRRIAKASDELSGMDFSSMSGVGKVLGRFFASRMSKLAGDTDVHFVTPEVMREISNAGEAHYGLFIHDGDRSQLFIRDDIPDGVGYGTKGHTLLHELAHKATIDAIDHSPGAGRMIKKLANEVYHANDIDIAMSGDRLKYAFTNAKEFVAEAFSNEHFQELLANTPISKELAAELGLGRKRMSSWDLFRKFVKEAIEKITGQMPQFDSALDGIMRIGEHLTESSKQLQEALRAGEKSGEEPLRGKRATEQEALGPVSSVLRGMSDEATRVLREAKDGTAEERIRTLPIRTFDNIAQAADRFFGENNPVRKVYNAVEKMRVRGETIFAKTEPLLRELVDARSQDPAAFREFASLMHDATVANVHPDVPLTDAKNAHLGKKRVVGDAVWAKAQHGDLAARFEALPEHLQELWHDVTKHYADTQNKMSLGIIENRILKLMGVEDAALARRVHEGTLTDADRELLGEDNAKILEDAGELSKIEGPYVPLMRRGDHVVKGDYKVEAPAGAKVLSPNEFEFTDKKAAEAYAKNNDLKTTIKKVWVDEDTGETHAADPDTGDLVKISAKDINAVPRYRAQVQNRHVEFVEGRRAAEKRAAELAAGGDMDVHKVVPREYEVSGRQATELSASLQRLTQKLERSEAYKQASPSEKAALRQAINEAAAASHGSTRISSRALPRRGVQGYSEDLVKNMADYGESSSRYLAKLEHGTELEDAMKEMEEAVKARPSERGQYGRTQIRNEVVKRVSGENGFQQGGKFAPVVKRAMSISFIDKLASPAYSVVNAMQPGMVTMPYLAGRHGVGRTVANLARAHNDIGAGQIVKQGIKETGRRLAGGGAPDDFITNAKGLLKDADEKAMLDHMVEHGVVDPSAGMEIRALVKDHTGVGGKIDAGLGYLEGVTREMPRAIEAINRMTTALAAYRMEKARGADHEAALQYAQDAVNNTQFNYSPTNSPSVFNHPLAKMAFQFKKYGQGIYQLIGSQIGKAYRNASPGDRAEAVKTLITMAGTHMAMAGAMGLPTEPIKYMVMASGLVGGPQWGDVEDKIRKEAVALLGQTGGEVFTRGLPRLLNIDMQRVGLDSVTSFGEPRKPKESDVKTWLFDTVSGPVASLGIDYAKSINLIANGDYEKAAELMIPIKAASDALRAYRQSTEGKVNASGKQTSKPYSWGEAALRVAGFGSGREAEEGAANSMYYRRQQEQKDERSELISAWSKAAPADKGKAMAAVTKWNQQQPAEVRIKTSELVKKKDTSNTVRGIKPTRRDKHILNETSIYNTR